MRAAVICAVCVHGAHAEEALGPGLIPVAGEQKNVERAAAVNVDMQIGYGQYNNVLSSVNLSNEQEDAVYLVSASLKRSDDFGYNANVYRNSSYSEDKIGYTGNFNISDTWRSLIEAEVYNDSRGMFDNAVFSREEKNEARFSLKNVYKLSNQFECFLLAGGGEYTHRLRPMLPQDRIEGRLFYGDMNIGGEYIWSASNRVRGKSEFYYYNYRGESPEDMHSSSELVDDFNLTRNVGISVGLNADFNKDAAPLVFPNFVLTIKGFAHASFALSYRYDLAPFRPEVFYLEQKYIEPSLDLPPSRVHHGEAKSEVRFNDTVTLKLTAVGERSDNFYNYATGYGDVLSTYTLPVTLLQAKFDAGFLLFAKSLEILLGYEFNHYQAEDNITYRPVHKMSGGIVYTGKLWRMEWNNKIMSMLHTDPVANDTLNGAVIGALGVQRRMLESFFAFVRAENIYNYRYNLRDGYPEPGITVLFGTRILI
ncbi:MAG: hypothetical protein EPN93_18245 [Spirochaetes bacterium]|nr:MAG: hypothetical protein EPN93_18245 [Spirochaetota bacterium]